MMESDKLTAVSNSKLQGSKDNKKDSKCRSKVGLPN